MSFDKPIYLDHAATTPTDERVLGEMLPYFSGVFGNASSTHRMGRKAIAAVDSARERVAKAIGASPGEIYFTSGGTEGDNWAIEGVARAYGEKGKHIVSSAIEHPAVLQALRRLEKEGFEVTYLPVDREGFVSPEAAIAAFRPDTILLSLMLANNEVGTIQPVKDIAKEAHARGILVHTDAVQAVGSIPVAVRDLGVDLLTLSAHKFYGPKGVGALYLRKGCRIKGLLVGGEQERALRAGTYNTPAIVGLGKAIELATEELSLRAKHLSELKSNFREKLAELPFVTVNGGEPALPGTINLLFRGAKNDDLLSALDLEGIAASAGSACSSGSVEPSHVLTAMGLSKKEVTSSLRFSFGKENTREEVDRTLAVLEKLLPRLRGESDLFLLDEKETYEV